MVLNSTATLGVLLVLHFVSAETYFEYRLWGEISLQAKGAKLTNGGNQNPLVLAALKRLHTFSPLIAV